MKKLKRLVAVMMVASLAFALTACGTKSEKAAKEDKLVIAYQMGLSYTPLLVMKEQNLIEKHYGKKVKVDWKVMASGAAISEGITADSIDIGALGTSVAISGIASKAPYKICTGLAAVSCGIHTNDSSIKTLKDIKAKDQIVVTQINSQPHILLSMAAKKELGDAHALDANLVAMANADGYSALMTGAVKCNMVLAPYNLMEVKEDNIHEIKVSEDVWPKGDTSIVGIASEKLNEKNPELYNAFCEATKEAMEYIQKNPEETAKILTESYDATQEEIASWLKNEEAQYKTEVQGVMKLSQFMVEEGFLDKGPKDIKEIVFDNVKGN